MKTYSMTAGGKTRMTLKKGIRFIFSYFKIQNEKNMYRILEFTVLRYTMFEIFPYQINT